MKNVILVRTRELTMHIITVAAVSLCLVLLSGSGAFAQEKAYAKDAECLAQHKEELTPGCKLRVAEVVEQIREVHQACQGDIMRFCTGVKLGGDPGADCICFQAGDRYNRDTCICH